MTLSQLKRIATESAKLRGHTLGAWYLDDGQSALAKCIHCHAGVFLNTKPAPNGIEIHGTAVAINCKPR